MWSMDLQLESFPERAVNRVLVEGFSKRID